MFFPLFNSSRIPGAVAAVVKETEKLFFLMSGFCACLCVVNGTKT